MRRRTWRWRRSTAPSTATWESFNFVHTASIRGADRSDEFLTVVSSSGTGELAEISGAGGMAVDPDGTHRIQFDYTLE